MKSILWIKGDIENGQNRHIVETIVTKQREAEVLMAKGQTIEEVVRQLGISDAMYYEWWKE